MPFNISGNATTQALLMPPQQRDMTLEQIAQG